MPGKCRARSRLGKSARAERFADCRLQMFGREWTRETTCKSGGELRQSQYLKATFIGTSRSGAAHLKCERTLHNRRSDASE